MERHVVVPLTLAIDGLMPVHCVWQVIFAAAGPTSARCRECRAFDRTRTRSAFLVDGDGGLLRDRGREEDEHQVDGVRDRDEARRQVRRGEGIREALVD